LVVFPNCKINLGLHIIRKRADGYHDLQTVFYPVPLHDALEVIHANDKKFQFQQSGLTIAGDANNNLCVKAYQLLQKDFPSLPAVHMHLHKIIPMGAGLGGGSANGAYTLYLLNKKFQLDISEKQLLAYALELGSDCPFFIINQPSFAEGRGELLQPVQLDLSGYKIILINPNIHINTGWAFSQIQPQASLQSLKDIIKQPIETWRDNLLNDFEAPVLKAHPQLAQIKNVLYQKGAAYASMTGSGSTFFGLFKSDTIISMDDFEEFHFKKLLSLK
jgi:4-diphosphocytidyl-2-C-methyl-D-erythritol kinase